MSLGMYVHIPFCITKCSYCDFVSYGLKGKRGFKEKDMERYLTFLLREAAMYQRDRFTAEHMVKTLYIGGGTPTCLSGGQLFLLLNSLQNTFRFEEGAEITVEGNPGTMDRKKLQALREGGCNRLSLGAQSFNPRELKVLGRIHSTQDIYNSYNLVREAGFNNLNLDLMYGLPGQDMEDWRKNLEIAAILSPEHLSIYQLNIEQDTPFHTLRQKGLLAEFEQETALRMFEETIDYLSGKGYRHYEVSNFAKPGYESRHNQLYWNNLEYLGLGAGASGYLNGVRYSNEPDLMAYETSVLLGKKPVRDEDRIDRELAMAESMFLGLRLLEGVDKKAFYNKFGVDIADVYKNPVEQLKQQGLLAESDTHVFLTRKGLYLANLVFMEFLD